MVCSGLNFFFGMSREPVFCEAALNSIRQTEQPMVNPVYQQKVAEPGVCRFGKDEQG
jgi:hypothetical protein